MIRRLSNFLARGAPGLAALVAFLAVPAQAQIISANAGLTQSVNVAAGASVSVPIVIDVSAAGGANIASLSATVTWNTARLTFVSVNAGATGWTFTPNVANAGTGSLTFVASNATALPATATLATVVFTAIGSGGSRVTVAPTAAANVSLQSVLPFTFSKAYDVCVGGGAGGVWGDANNDGVVSIIDAQQLARFSVGLSVANATTTAARGDVTNDGVVNIVDAQQTARFSVGLSASARLNTAIPGTSPVASATLTPGTGQSLAIGATLQLTGTPRDAGAVDLSGCGSFNWSSSSPGVATVSADGVVQGLSPGTTTITATSTSVPGVTASLAVTVSGTPIIRTSFNHAGLSARTYVAQITGPGISAFASQVVNGSSMHGTTMDLAVPQSGTYTVRIAALNAGDATNRVFLVGAQATVVVPAGGGMVTQSLSLTAPTFTMTTLPTTATTGNAIPVAFSVNDPSGLIDARGNGFFCGEITWTATTITSDFQSANGGNRVDICSLTHTTNTLAYSGSIPAQGVAGSVGLQVWTAQLVNFAGTDLQVLYVSPSLARGEPLLSVAVVQVNNVTVTPMTPTVAVGGTLQMVATARDVSANVINGLTTTWLSSTPSVGTVSTGGLFTGVANGPTTVTATIGGVSGNTTVSVSGGINVGSITVAALPTLTGNGTTTAVATVRDPGNNIIGAAVTWSSSNPMIARVASDGAVTALGSGTTNIIATIGAVTGTAALTVNSVASAYNIIVRYVNGTPTPAVQAAFTNAANRWAQIIRGDEPAVTLTNFTGCGLAATPLNEVIDDLVIYADVSATIDGVGNILGQAGPCATRGGSGHAYLGQMQFDAADLGNMETNGTLTAVILHEMGHVLGIGTNWNSFLQNPAPAGGGGDPIFTGPNAVWAFNNLGTGYGGTPVPAANVGGAGTLNAHWRKTILQRELMTGSIGAGVTPLSPLTAASLIDLGYVIDVSQSDVQPWFLRRDARVFGAEIELKEGTVPPPLVTDLFGRPVGPVNGALRAAGPLRPPPKNP